MKKPLQPPLKKSINVFNRNVGVKNPFLDATWANMDRTQPKLLEVKQPLDDEMSDAALQVAKRIQASFQAAFKLYNAGVITPHVVKSAQLEQPEKLEHLCPTCHNPIDKCTCPDRPQLEATEDEGTFGTKLAGYAKHDKLSFCCHDCKHMDSGSCDHPKVIADPEVPKKDGKAQVEPDACCTYWHPEEGY